MKTFDASLMRSFDTLRTSHVFELQGGGKKKVVCNYFTTITWKGLIIGDQTNAREKEKD